MPNDYYTLEYIIKEIRLNCLTCRIANVYSYRDKTIVFSLTTKSKGSKFNLIVISCSSSLPILFQTQTDLEKDANPNGFIMSFRKHLTGARLVDIALCESDRIIKFEFIQKNELFDEERFFLFFEIIGKKVNLILTNVNSIIINAYKINNSPSGRLILPSMKYDFPINNLNVSTDSIWKLGKLSREEYLNLQKNNYLEINNSFHNISNNFLSPCVLLDGNKVIDFFVFPYSSITLKEGMSWKNCSSLSECVELFYLNNVPKPQNTEIFSLLLKSINNLLQTNINRLEQLNKTALQVNELTHLKQQAEIFKCNIFKVKPNCSSISCIDYFNDNIPINITYDPLLSASENLIHKYKKYTKLKRSIEYSKAEIPNTKSNIEHLLSIIDELSLSSEKDDFECILSELNKTYGILPGFKATNKNPSLLKKARENFIKVKIDSFTILIGKNNVQNDEITFHYSNPNDIWFHAQKCHGGHVLIKSNNSSVPIAIIEKAASFAAFFSKGRMDSKINVDYTYIKNVKRGERPGLVKYVNFKTMTVAPTNPFPPIY